MPNLHINIANKVATYTLRDGAVVCDNTDYTAVFTFDAEWTKEAKKVARFVWKGRHHDVDIQADGTCALPRIQGAKVIHVGVYAGELRTTTSAEIPCEGSILSKPTEPQEGYAAGYVEEIRAAVQHTDEVAKATEDLLGDASSTLSRVEKEVQNLRQAIAPEFFQTDSGAAYTKTVPDNALPFAEVEEIGGMTYAQDGILKHTDVVALEIQGRNILDLTPALNASLKDNGDGTYTLRHNAYGNRFSAKAPIVLPHPTESNGVNCSIEVVGGSVGTDKLELRTFDANGADLSYFGMREGGADFGIKGVSVQIYLSSNTKEGDYITFRAPMIKLGAGYIGYKPYTKRSWLLPDEVLALPGWGLGVDAVSHNRLLWSEKKYRQEVSLRAYESGDESNPDVVTDGVSTVAKLATPVVTDVSDILPDDNFIEVEGGGTITAMNQYGLAAPTAITYQLKEV